MNQGRRSEGFSRHRHLIATSTIRVFQEIETRLSISHRLVALSKH